MDTVLTGEWAERTTLTHGVVKVVLWTDGSRAENKGIEVWKGEELILCRSWEE